MDFSLLHTRAGRLFDDLHVAPGYGSFARRMSQLAKLDLLLIDDFAISPMAHLGGMICWRYLMIGYLSALLVALPKAQRDDDYEALLPWSIDLKLN